MTVGTVAVKLWMSVRVFYLKASIGLPVDTDGVAPEDDNAGPDFPV